MSSFVACLLAFVAPAAAAPAGATIGPGGVVTAGPVRVRLPSAWHEITTEAEGPTWAVSFPTIAGDRPGTVILQAAAPHGAGSLFVARVDAPLSVDDTTKDDLAVAAPDAFRRLWGVDYRVTWAEVAPLAGRPAIRIEGRFERDGAPYTVVSAFVPAADGRRHFVVSYLVPGGSKPALTAALGSLETFDPGDEARASPGQGRRRALGALAGGLVGLALALGLRARRRRRQRSARTSG